MDDKERADQASNDPTDGPGNVSVDEPTEHALDGTEDKGGFGEEAPAPPDPKS